MAEKMAFSDQIADRVEPFLDEVATHVAKMQRPVAGNERVGPTERQQRWWQEEDGWTPEKTWFLLGFEPDGVTARLDPQTGQPVKGMSREDVGLLRYPYREIDMRAASDDGDDDEAMAKYARDMTALGPPPPDPLEVAAAQAQQPAPSVVGAPPVMPDATGVPQMGVV